jgi:hypothetical protein
MTAIGPRLLVLLLLATACGRTELDQFAGDGGAAGAGGAAGRGGGGAGGASGAGGQAPVPIPCGATSCTPGVQACCIQADTQMCVSPQAPCGGGASIGCLDGASCTGGNVCCLSVVGGGTGCLAPSVCSIAGGGILCTTDAHCPSATPRCCRLGMSGLCAPQCPN